MSASALLPRNMNGGSPFEEQRTYQMVQDISSLSLMNGLDNHSHSGFSMNRMNQNSGHFQPSQPGHQDTFLHDMHRNGHFVSDENLYNGHQMTDIRPPCDDPVDPFSNGHALSHSISVPRKNPNTTLTVPVPSSEHVAEIVGRQGCKIKSLRTSTNTYIKTPVRGSDPVFVVTGRKEDVTEARRQILSAAEHFSNLRAKRNGGGGVHISSSSGSSSPTTSTQVGHITSLVRVPYKVVGLVVGPKGATIKRIQQTTSTYIVTPGRDKEPVFEVTGLPENVENAKEEIEKHIASRTGTDNNSDLQIDEFQPCYLDPNYSDESSDCKQSTIVNVGGYNDYSSSMNIVNGHDNLPPLSSISNMNGSSHIYQHMPGPASAPLHKHIGPGPVTVPNTSDFNIFNHFQHNGEGLKGMAPSEHEADSGIGTHGSSAVSIYDPNTLWSDSSSFSVQRSNSVSSRYLPAGEDGPHPRTRRTNSDPLAAAFQKIDAAFSSSSVSSSQDSISPANGRHNDSPTSHQPPVGTVVTNIKPGPCYSCGGEVNAALVPCGHNNFCMRCAEEICQREPGRRLCPLCHKAPEGALMRVKP